MAVTSPAFAGTFEADPVHSSFGFAVSSAREAFDADGRLRGEEERCSL